MVQFSNRVDLFRPIDQGFLLDQLTGLLANRLGKLVNRSTCWSISDPFIVVIQPQPTGFLSSLLLPLLIPVIISIVPITQVFILVFVVLIIPIFIVSKSIILINFVLAVVIIGAIVVSIV